MLGVAGQQYCARFHEALVVQNSIVLVQNNGKEKTKKPAARANLFFANWKRKCAARAICFFAN